MTKINTFYWSDVPNWGDNLSPYLQQYAGMTFNLVDRILEASLLTIGSSLQTIPPGWKGIVAGTGALFNKRALHLDHVTILGVRGKLSAELAGDSNIPLGDPGLLISKVWPNNLPKRWDIGILPHWSDTRLKYDQRFYGNWKTLFINPFKHPNFVVNSIIQCEKIVTSSLHGMIVADSYGIPRRLEAANRMQLDSEEGGFFKYEDYLSSIGEDLEFGKLKTANPHWISARQSDIITMFKEIKNHL